MSQTETKWTKGFYQNLKNVNGKNVVETKIKVQDFIACLLEHQDEVGEIRISAWPKKQDDGKGTLVPVISDWRPAKKEVEETLDLNPEGNILPF